MPNILKRALLIGINYTGTSSALNGCINDSINLKNFLIKNKYFKANEILMMNDKKKGTYYPSRSRIMLQLQNLVKFAKQHKDQQVLIFVSYSGHGTYIRDRNGDEEDGRDEALCPVDYSKSGFITDDIIKKNFVDQMPKNVKLVMLIDACHSGTMCDLKFEYKCDAKLNYNVCGANRLTSCNVVMISGCMDKQTSSDAFLKNRKRYQYQGAMTASFLSNYNDNISYYDLIVKMRKWLKNKKFDQIPQLSSGKLLNIKNNFLLTSYD